MAMVLTKYATYWWLEILVGAAFMAIGVWFYYTPLETYISFSILISFIVFFSGIVEILNAISFRKSSKKWIYYLMGGVIDLAIGAYLIGNEALTLEILPLLFGLWLLVRASIFFMRYGELRKGNTYKWGFLLTSALITLIMGIAVLMNSTVGALSIVYTLSFAFFFMGLYRFSLGLRLYKIRKGDF